MRIRATALAGCLLVGLAAAGEGKAMDSQTIIAPTASDDGGELVANTVAFQSAGGEVLIQWSLSYEARKATRPKAGHQRGRPVRPEGTPAAWRRAPDRMAAGFAETLQTTDSAPVGVALKGTASALHIVYLQARMEDKAACMLVVIGATPEGRKELVGCQVGVRESAQSWRELLIDLKARGLAAAPESL